jgi:hypothetical protein
MTFPAPGVYREDQVVRRVTLTVDVPEILRQLEALGMPDTEIMQRCGLKSRSPLYAWRSGEKMPSLLPGLRLLLLHLEHCPRFSPLRMLAELQAGDSHPNSPEGAEHGQAAEARAHAEPDRSAAGSESR